MFLFHHNVAINNTEQARAVQNAVACLRRDMKKCLLPSEKQGGEIRLERDETIAEEGYRIVVTEECMTVKASDELGFVYGLLLISERFLGVKPFWFWMDQQFTPVSEIPIEEQVLESPVPVVRFRGWFLNDEVLMLKWRYNLADGEGWRMALEALLRCGGNMVIPGTDKMSRCNRQLTK